jgi:hypothetical protein
LDRLRISALAAVTLDQIRRKPIQLIGFVDGDYVRRDRHHPRRVEADRSFIITYGVSYTMFSGEAPLLFAQRSVRR